MPKKNAVNTPQIVERRNAYNHPTHTASRAGSGKSRRRRCAPARKGPGGSGGGEDGAGRGKEGPGRSG